MIVFLKIKDDYFFINPKIAEAYPKSIDIAMTNIPMLGPPKKAFEVLNKKNKIIVKMADTNNVPIADKCLLLDSIAKSEIKRNKLTIRNNNIFVSSSLLPDHNDFLSNPL